MRKNLIFLAAWISFMLTISSQAAYAVILTPGSNALPGTTVAAEPQLAGIALVDELVPFSFLGYGGEGIVSGSVQLRIVESSFDNTLDFYWRVFNDENSAGAIGDFRIGYFETSIYNANYRIDGLGDVAPVYAYLFSSPYEGYVNFNFGDLLQPGTSSMFFFLDTDATNYDKTAIYDLTNVGQTQISGPYQMYAPAVASVPEPATLLLLGSGLIGLAAFGRKRLQN